MSTAPTSVTQSASHERTRPGWLYAAPMWAGLAIVSSTAIPHGQRGAAYVT